ncbi:MAG: Uma2 family endonuclease [Stanieria sp.]
MDTIAVSLPSPLQLSIDLTDEQFWQLCQRNRDYRFERNAQGDLIVMSPTGSDTGRRNLDIIVQLGNWNKQTQLGVAFDSSTGFKLPNGAERSPDASWIKKEQWESLTLEEKERFAPICPDFVVELRSKTDALKPLQEKMKEYLDNGTKLGWLIDRKNQQVEVYRVDREVEVIKSPQTLSGENILPGFVLDLAEIL